jgi:hypothetical protein
MRQASKQSVRGQCVCPSQLYILDIARGFTQTSPGLIQEEEWFKLQTKYEIELAASILIIRVKAVRKMSGFELYKLSLSLRDELSDIFKKTCPTYPVIMGPLLIYQ